MRAPEALKAAPHPVDTNAMAYNGAGRKQNFVALEGGDRLAEEVTLLRQEVARLEEQLEVERASTAALYAQLTTVSRQAEAAEMAPRAGFLGRRRR